MPLIKFCDRCKTQYDWERNSTACPHVGFPRDKKCTKHQRTNCGNDECQTNLTILPKRREQRA